MISPTRTGDAGKRRTAVTTESGDQCMSKCPVLPGKTQKVLLDLDIGGPQGGVTPTSPTATGPGLPTLVM